MDKLIPQSIEAECALLGSILIDPEVIVEIADTLEPADFYRNAHQEIYRAMKMLYQQQSEPADFITLSNYLEEHQQLEQVGGSGYILSLINHVPTSGHAEYYARIVSKKAQFRSIIHAAGQIAAIAYEEEEDALERTEQIVYAIGDRKTGEDYSSLADVMSDLSDEFERLDEFRGALTGIPTGFHGLDRLLGGLQDTDLILLAALPRIGKTSMALNIAHHVAFSHKYKVGVFSLEMSKKQLGLRLVAQDTHIDMQRIRRRQLSSDEDDQVSESLVRMMDGPIYINDMAGLTIDEIRSKARRMKAKLGIDLFIVDYLQLAQKYIDGKRMKERVQEIAEVARGLKNMAKDLNVPVLALAQLSRETEKHADQVPQLSDLAESSELEKAADIVLFLHRMRIDDKRLSDETNLIIEKHRNGPMGVIKLLFDGKETRFRNVVETGLVAIGSEGE